MTPPDDGGDDGTAGPAEDEEGRAAVEDERAADAGDDGTEGVQDRGDAGDDATHTGSIDVSAPSDDESGDDAIGDDETGDPATEDDETGDAATEDDATGDDATEDDATGDDGTEDAATEDDETGDHTSPDAPKPAVVPVDGADDSSEDGPGTATDDDSSGSDSGSLAGGRRDRRVAAFAYLLGPITAVVALAVARDAPVVRFHAVQSVAFVAVVALGALALSLLQFLLVFVPLIGNGLSIGFSFVWPLVAILVIRAWLRLGQAALDGRRLHYPVAGRLAERVA